jgi:hypothetical protein
MRDSPNARLAENFAAMFLRGIQEVLLVTVVTCVGEAERFLRGT